MKVLLVYNELALDTINMANSVCDVLQACQVDAVKEKADSQAIWQNDIDGIIVFGGDGTILRTAQHYGSFGLPVMGVNMGTVGFLSSVEVAEIEEYLTDFINGSYQLEGKMMLDVEIRDEHQSLHAFSCLNDLSVKSNNSKMIYFDMIICGQSSGSQRGDGLIIATPTGSTAYNLSAGGPVVDNDLDAIIVTPLSSYFLNKRPVVVAPDKDIRIDLHGMESALISIDGQVSVTLNPGQHLIINRSAHRFNLVRFKKQRFFETMERRLRRCEVTL